MVAHGVWKQLSAPGCLLAFPGPAPCPFQLLFALYALPCLPSPRLDLCPVSIMMLSDGDFKKAYLIMSPHT